MMLPHRQHRVVLLADHVRCTQADLPDLASMRAAVPAAGGFDVVNMIGSFEYLPDRPRDVGSMTIPSAGQLLSAAMSLAAPGGLVVFGNMLTTPPHKDYILRMVQRPYVQPRSIEDLWALLAEVGVDPQDATIYTPDDGVYTVVAIRVKPQSSNGTALTSCG